MLQNTAHPGYVAIEDAGDLARSRPAYATATAGRKVPVQTAILDGPILPTLIKLALPIWAVLPAQTAVYVAEAYFVGFLGTNALAGLALVFPVFMLMMTMSVGGLGSGVASTTARAIGAGRQHDADALVLHALILAVVVGALFTLGAIWGGPMLYHALGARDETLEAALKYSDTLFTGSIAVWVVNLLGAALRGSGKVKVPAAVTLIGALVMIPTSPVLIFGFGPIPRLGIAGAGIAIAVYYIAAMLVLLCYMASGRSGLALKLARLESRLFVEILKVGLPTALSTIQMNLSVLLVTGSVGLFGPSALAAYGIASRVDYGIIPILFGLASATLTMVGVNIGAGLAARAKQIAWVSSLLGASLTEGFGLITALVPTLWLHLFSQDATVLAPATTYLRVVAPFYGFWGLGFVISFAAQGARHVFWPFMGATARMLIAAGLGWIATKYFGMGIAGLALIVATSFVAYALISVATMGCKAVWRRPVPHSAVGTAASRVGRPRWWIKH